MCGPAEGRLAQSNELVVDIAEREEKMAVPWATSLITREAFQMAISRRLEP